MMMEVLPAVASQKEVLARERQSIEQERKRLRVEQAQLQEERERIERESGGSTVRAHGTTTRPTRLGDHTGASINTETGLFEPAGLFQNCSATTGCRFQPISPGKVPR